MPNHITNIVYARPEILKQLITEGRFDFEKVIPLPDGLYDPDMIAFRDEEEAKRLRMFSSNTEVHYPTEECRLMVESYRKTGHLHSMDFARNVWGTKWGSYDNNVERLEEGVVSFDTAWSTPDGIWERLAKKFPDEVITVEYADEDIGYNCGTLTLHKGEITKTVPDKQDADLFAVRVKGWSEDEIKEFFEERDAEEE